jgi:arginase
VLPEDLSEECLYLDVAAVRDDPAGGGRRGAEHAADGTAGFWLHLDLDALDEAEFPATDYLDPGGLTWPELTELVTPLAGSPRCLGMTVACYNPEKDPDGAHGERIVEALAAALAPALAESPGGG